VLKLLAQVVQVPRMRLTGHAYAQVNPACTCCLLCKGCFTCMASHAHMSCYVEMVKQLQLHLRA
jgi:hypothetical protein